MQRKEPLKEILAANRALWDHDGMRPSVRVNFTKVLMCRTEALGAEVYASSTVQKIAPTPANPARVRVESSSNQTLVAPDVGGTP